MLSIKMADGSICDRTRTHTLSRVVFDTEDHSITCMADSPPIVMRMPVVHPIPRPCCTWHKDRIISSENSEDFLESTHLPDHVMNPHASYDLAVTPFATRAPPLVEYRLHRSVAKYEGESVFHQYLGELELALDIYKYPFSAIFSVHVTRARGLRSRLTAICDSYVKVAVIPSKRAKTCFASQRTEVAVGSNHPFFEETLTLEVPNELLDQRLHISVWHNQGVGKDCELLGTMSFTLNKLYNQVYLLSGWYYLLPPHIGNIRNCRNPDVNLSHSLSPITDRAAGSDRGMVLDIAPPPMPCNLLTPNPATNVQLARVCRTPKVKPVRRRLYTETRNNAVQNDPQCMFNRGVLSPGQRIPIVHLPTKTGARSIAKLVRTPGKMIRRLRRKLGGKITKV